METMQADRLWAIAEVVPPEWYGGDVAVIEQLMEKMLLRRGRLRELIGSFRDSTREPFPMWEKKLSVSVPTQFEEGTIGKFVM
jgi:hypothetical protein